jgi:flagellar biosynthesis protein FlhB
MAGEKTEAPTPRRLDDARKRGQVNKSQEIVSIGVLLAAVIAVKTLGPAVWEGMGEMLRDDLGRAQRTTLTPETTMGIWRTTGTSVLLLLAPLFAVLMVGGVVLNVAQTGLLFSGAGLKPRWGALNPMKGAKKILSAEGLAGLLKAVAKMSVVAVFVTMIMRDRMAEIATMGGEDVGQAARHMARLSYDIAIRSAVVLFILAIADWAWQRRRYLSQLRMTKEEVKQEMKESDGDPQIKAAIRRRRQQMMTRMLAAVPRADVVVTNPTHFAVALKYDPVSMGAPMVVAKGQDLLAKRIREMAREHGVAVFEEPPLARALYKHVAVGAYVPANLFHAVAEVLAWVYALRAKATNRWTAPAGQGA